MESVENDVLLKKWLTGQGKTGREDLERQGASHSLEDLKESNDEGRPARPAVWSAGERQPKISELE